MGGDIRVIIREKSGNIIKMNRWTNSFPDFINSPKFISKDISHYDAYMKSFYEMKKDWEANHESGEFKYPMTDFYFPDDGLLAPSGYGILLIDYMKEKVMSVQGYASLGRFDELILHTLFDKKICDDYIMMGLIPKEQYEGLVVLFNDGKLNQISTYNPDTKSIEFNDVTKEELEVFVRDNLKIKKPKHFECIINMDPWEIVRFEETDKGLAEAKEFMENLGFEFTDADNKRWNSFYDYRK